MALSEIAESRKVRISEWIRDQITDGGYNHDITSERRRITEARIYGLGGWHCLRDMEARNSMF